MRKMKDSGIEWIGEIPESWSTQKIKYCFSLIAGATPKSGNSEYWDGDIVWITPADFTTKDMYVKNGHQTITVEGLESCATTIVPIDSIIFSKRAPVGLVAINQVPLCTNQGCISCIPNEGFHSKFYYYAMSVFSEQFDLFASGTTFKEISAEAFANFILPFAKYEDQIRIADYLDQKCAEIDAIIAAKEKTNELLKERRQSIIYEAVTKGLDPTVPMKDSGVEWIGEIPESWSFSKLKYDAYMKGRIGWQGLKADEFIEEGPYLVTGTDFEDGKVRWERSYHISEERFNEAPEIQLKEQDLLITKDGTIGKLAYIDYLPGLASLNSHLLVIRPKRERFLNKYLYWVLSSDVFFQYTEYAQDGTIMASLSQEKISQFVFGLPSIQEQQMIEKYLDEQCAEIDALISANESTIEKLKEYRQSVIYEAVTGKVEV